MDKEKTKEILDYFENDNFVDAKEILTQEIKSKVTQHIYDKTGVNLVEGATENALKTLKAIIGSLKDDKKNDIYKMGQGMMDSYKKNKGFSPKQAEWIFKTSQAMFK